MGVLIDPTEFQCLRVLVTEGADGIGAAVARRLALGGARVAVTASRPPADKAGARVIRADLASEEGLEAVLRGVGEALGGLDILVSNLARAGGGSWRDALETGFLAAARLDEAFVPAMLDQGGAIVHLAPAVPAEADPPREAAAAALAAYSRGLAQRLGPRGVRVSLVTPAAPGRPDPARRAGPARPEDIAELVAFLVSDRAAAVSGGVHVIDYIDPSRP